MELDGTVAEPGNGGGKRRPVIAFFDYPDVFEDFYPHYGVSQHEFATRWHNTANHAWLAIIQKEIGDVIWYQNSLRPEVDEETHGFVGCRVKFVASSWPHRLLWKAFYGPSFAWRWRRFYGAYALAASYLAPCSMRMFLALRRDRPDAIYVQDYCSGRYDVLLLFAGMLGIPFLAFHSGSTLREYHGRALRSWTIRRADWIFPSGTNERRLLHEKFRFPLEKQTIIRPPIDTTIYRPMDRNDSCEACGLDPGNRYLIFIGRLDDGVKRLSSMIDAFAGLVRQHPHFEMLIVGGGNDERALKSHAEAVAPGKVRFLGWVAEDEQKARILNTADCLMLASWREASPAVIGEAFSCGVPVISSRVGCIDDLVIDDETGWLFEAGDDDGLRRCMENVMTRRQMIQEMRAKVRQRALEMVSAEAVARALREGFSRFF